MKTGTRKILRIVAISVAALIVVVVVAAIFVARTLWFRDYVRARVVAAVENSTGASAEIGAFMFDWRQLRADIRDLTLHGTEPAGAAPLLKVDAITVRLRASSLWKRHRLDLQSLSIQQPRVNVIILADGSTNIPGPKIQQHNGKTGLEDIVDLAIGEFQISGGAIEFADRKLPLTASGRNLNARLAYETAGDLYRGQIAISRLFIQSSANPRLDVKVDLPLVLRRDRIDLSNALISTASSRLEITGTADHLVSPKVSARADGQIDLAEVKRALGVKTPLNVSKSVPHVIDLEVGLNTETEGGRISNAHIVLGRSSLDLKASFADISSLRGSAEFTSNLALNELGKIFQLPFQAAGTVQVAGNAGLNGISSYTINADVSGRNLEYRDGDINISGLTIDSRVNADARSINANPIRAAWLGGHLDAHAAVQEFSHYRVEGSVSGFDVRQIAAQLAAAKVGYGGIVSGTVRAEGSLKAPGAGLQMALARLSISPIGGGVPVRGQINANYDIASQTSALTQSFIALPSSRLEMNGAVGRQMVVHLVSRNLDDFKPLAPDMPLRFDPGGSAVLDATVTGQVTAPMISGHAAMTKFAAAQRHFDVLSADFDARGEQVSLRNGLLTHGDLNAQFQASVGLDRWKATPSQPVQATLSMRNADVADLLALAGQENVPARGSLTISADASGTLGNPQGSANILVANGAAYGQPIDRLDGHITFGGELVTVNALKVASGTSRIDLRASFQHPKDEFSTGTVNGHIDASQVTLGRIQPLHQRRPDLDGDIDCNMDAVARIDPPSVANRLQLVSANGSVGARMLRINGENLGRIAADIQTSGKVISYRIDSDFAGSSVRADGRTDLSADYQTTANLNIRNLPIEKALEIAGERNLAARGMLTANGQVSGTIRDPHANLDLALTRAVVQAQPIDQLQTHVDYSSTVVNVPALFVQTGSNRITANGSFSHPSGDFGTGTVNVHVDTDALQLSAVRYLQQLRPSLSGSLQVNLDAAGTLNHSSTEPRIMLSSLSGKISGNGIRSNGKDLGNFTATAAQSGTSVNIDLDSNLAQSKIHLNGQARLERDYPVNAQLTFENVRYANLEPLLGGSGPAPAFDALLEGSANVQGPASSPADVTGSIQILKLQVTPSQTATLATPKNSAGVLALHNDGPISMIANQGSIQVQRAHIVGPSADVSVTGNVQLKPSTAFNLSVNANTDLALIQEIDKTSSSTGTIALNAAITGSLPQPAVNGRMLLKNAAYQKLDWPIGISNANGEVVFTGSTARIQSLTAESGGGRLTATGFLTRSGSGFTFNLQSRATRVLVRTDDGVSLRFNSNLRLSGTDRNSVLGGDVNIVSLGFNPQGDVGSILTRTSAPMQTPSTPEGLLANMNMDVAVRIAPGASVQSAFAQGIQAQAELTVRGNVLDPGMVGRINVSQGNLIFFGTKYTINQGSVTFLNPYKIEPLLDMNLETSVQSVDVVLTVTGPVENMNLSYHSDPPLPFSEIVALLGAGKTPTSDPVLLANQPAVPQQSFTDMGASALLGAAVANPVAGQLQRVFGVSQLKIAPTFVTGSTLPQARVTLQQQVSQSVTFSYITDLTQPDSQIIRIEWAINPQWSAIASREINGLVGVDLFYKRRFR